MHDGCQSGSLIEGESASWLCESIEGMGNSFSVFNISMGEC
jgi:hypothetical protein